ncbi:unnamed protein product [Penicillium nalgiovense]|nr:unnamed protein product [Penicillium nalgiovense]
MAAHSSETLSEMLPSTLELFIPGFSIITRILSLYSRVDVSTCSSYILLFTLLSAFFEFAAYLTNPGISRSRLEISSGYSAMEVMGYGKLQAGSPPEDMVRGVVRSLRSRPSQVSETVTYGRGDHDACERFLRFGIQDHDFTRKIEEVIGRPAFLLHQNPVIVHSPDLPTNWGINAAHPVRNGVSVFRTLSGDLEDSVATLNLYPISRHLSSAEFAQEKGTPRSFNLISNEVLFVRGALKMEISLPAGGSLVWQGFPEDPRGIDPSAPEAFAFMRI